MPQQPIARRRRTSYGLFVGALVILSLLFVLGATSFSRTSAAAAHARLLSAETRATLGAATEVLLTLVDAETGQRGYLISGDERYLDPYVGRRPAFEQSIALLKDLARSRQDRTMADQIARIEELGVTRFRYLDDGIAAQRAGRAEEARAILLAGNGKRIMDQVRDLLGRLREAEQARLDAANAAADRSLKRSRDALAVLSLLVLLILVSTWFLLRRAVQSEEDARHAAALRQERDRANLLGREMSHRIKNLFAVIMSIISTTGRHETDAREAARKIRERVQALARAHALSNGQDQQNAAALGDLAREIVGPYAPRDRPVLIEGPDLHVSADRVTPIGLILNELATNAVKYGAWSRPAGTVTIRWALDRTKGPEAAPGAFRLEWIEQADGQAMASPDRQGFGTNMIDLSAVQARSRLTREWTDTGLRVILDFEAGPPELGQSG